MAGCSMIGVIPHMSESLSNKSDFRESHKVKESMSKENARKKLGSSRSNLHKNLHRYVPSSAEASAIL